MFRELVRKNKKLSMEESIHILKTEKRGVLSVNGDNNYPYGMPMNHWYNEEDGKIYFHSGNVGHRLDSLKKDSKVSFCAYSEGYCNPDEWALNIKSVIVFGKIEIVDAREKIVDFVIFFNQCGMKEDFDSINKMDNDVLLMTYERLLEQKYQEKLELDKMNNHMK